MCSEEEEEKNINNNGDDNDGVMKDLKSSMIKLPKPELSIIISGFVPRDSLFNMLFSSISSESYDPCSNMLPQKSMHIFR